MAAIRAAIDQHVRSFDALPELERDRARARIRADAIVAIHTTSSRTDAKRLWVLAADLSAAFDRLDHDQIRQSLGLFPGRGLGRRLQHTNA